MYTIQLLNNISTKGIGLLDHKSYKITEDEDCNPDAILVRSAKMHEMKIDDNLLSVGRAGSGVNNIPLDKMSENGIVVFNAPGANANAVKELVIAGMLMASRNLTQAFEYVKNLKLSDDELPKQIEAGKKMFAGHELPGKTLGVIGLGAIGVNVANAALDLGMNVIGYDPSLTVKSAWRLKSAVQNADDINDLFANCDYISFHVPLLKSTANLINKDNILTLKKGVVVLNFARDGIVDDLAIIDGIEQQIIKTFVTDFPSNKFKGIDDIISLPHLGASTAEAEDNCAIMVAEQTKDYLENGNIKNSVNLPNLFLPRKTKNRLTIINKNQPDMVAQISHTLGECSINIKHMANESRGDYAYTIIDVDGTIPNEIICKLSQIDGIIKARII
ncbi:MAG: 3-phosphoglycerate dehydrogenase [Gammaproteobacteria bacterium]|nr:MAG: 3-phosphoglycerate dehydrogenase [Gammaproteobacteria bacterium]